MSFFHKSKAEIVMGRAVSPNTSHSFRPFGFDKPQNEKGLQSVNEIQFRLQVPFVAMPFF
jgi:hypothetical protein